MLFQNVSVFDTLVKQFQEYAQSRPFQFVHGTVTRYTVPREELEKRLIQEMMAAQKHDGEEAIDDGEKERDNSGVAASAEEMNGVKRNGEQQEAEDPEKPGDTGRSHEENTDPPQETKEESQEEKIDPSHESKDESQEEKIDPPHETKAESGKDGEMTGVNEDQQQQQQQQQEDPEKGDTERRVENNDTPDETEDETDEEHELNGMKEDEELEGEADPEKEGRVRSEGKTDSPHGTDGYEGDQEDEIND